MLNAFRHQRNGHAGGVQELPGCGDVLNAFRHQRNGHSAVANLLRDNDLRALESSTLVAGRVKVNNRVLLTAKAQQAGAANLRRCMTLRLPPLRVKHLAGPSMVQGASRRKSLRPLGIVPTPPRKGA